MNSPAQGIEAVRFNGSVSLVADNPQQGLICSYIGDLVVTRNSKISGWYSVENFIPDRNQRNSDFTTQFYPSTEWTHVPDEEFSSFKRNYLRATVHPGSKALPAMAEARFYVAKSD